MEHCAAPLRQISVSMASSVLSLCWRNPFSIPDQRRRDAFLLSLFEVLRFKQTVGRCKALLSPEHLLVRDRIGEDHAGGS